MQTSKEGLSVSIYRDGYDCVINVLHGKKSATITEIKAPHSVTDEAPELRIVRRNLFGKEYIHAEPVNPGMYAFGGSFVYSCDSRFSELSKYPIPLHDRDMARENQQRNPRS